MSDEVKIELDGGFEEPKPQSYIQEAGIYTNAFVGEATLKEAVEAKVEDGKETKAGYGASFSLELKLDDGRMYNARIFSPPIKAEELKFYGKFYKDGVAIRDNTPEEQIKAQWGEFMYLLGQLGLAMGHSWENVRNILYPKVGDFKGVVTAFITAFLLNKPVKRLNFRLVWNNSDKTKKSFLAFPKASIKSAVFEKYVQGQQSRLQFAQWELEKGMDKCRYKFKPKSSNGVEMDGEPISASGQGFKPVEIPDAPDGDLF